MLSTGHKKSRGLVYEFRAGGLLNVSRLSLSVSLILGPRRLIDEVTRSHTFRHPYPMGLLWTSDKLVAEASTYTTQNTQKRITFLPSSIRILTRDPNNRSAIDLRLITALTAGSTACSISNRTAWSQNLPRELYSNSCYFLTMSNSIRWHRPC